MPSPRLDGEDLVATEHCDRDGAGAPTTGATPSGNARAGSSSAPSIGEEEESVGDLRLALARLESQAAELEAEARWLERQGAKGAVPGGGVGPFAFQEAGVLRNGLQNPVKPPCPDPEATDGKMLEELDVTKRILEQLVGKVDKLYQEGPRGRRRLDSTISKEADMLRRAETEANRDENDDVLANSVLAMAPPLQALVYLFAFSGIVFTLVFPALEKSGSVRRLVGAGGDDLAGAEGRRLGGPAGGVIVAVCYSTLGAGLMALIVSFLRQPILIGYILGGVLVGPNGLALVDDYLEILTIMDLGLVLLLFMIGLEVDLHALIHMNKMTCVTGFLQFPICAGIHLLAFWLISLGGANFGSGKWSLGYLAVACGASSTMIVVKTLSHKMETDTGAGKFTLGILLFQDFWAFLMIAVQGNIEDPVFLDILKDFAFMGVLINVSFLYAKYVLPPIFQRASGSTELMLVLALAWCFFLCCGAALPFINLSIEVAAFIGGVSMATFPFNAELNSKIKYIRDYFITLYFVGVGMQMILPSGEMLVCIICVTVVVLLTRWVGIFFVSIVQGSGPRLAILATLNLSQCSEFGLVLCTLGRKLGHIDDETMSIAIWVFAVLAGSASYIIGYNHSLYHAFMHKSRALPQGSRLRRVFGGDEGQLEDDEDAEERDIVFLGFHKIAAALIAEFEHKAPQIMRKLLVLDHKNGLKEPLHAKKVAFSACDVTAADTIRACVKQRVDLVLITIPDYIITGVSNERLLMTAREVWPDCHIIVIADEPKQIRRLYDKGANYVLATKKLSAERIAGMLTEHYSDGTGGELKHHLAFHRHRESEWRAKLIDLNLGPQDF